MKFAKLIRIKSLCLNILKFFGADGNTAGCVDEIRSLANAMDEHVVSWVYWAYKLFGDYMKELLQNEVLFVTESDCFNISNKPKIQNQKVIVLATNYVQK